jgi:glycosyltransferase involved in cell wall biosynthesis
MEKKSFSSYSAIIPTFNRKERLIEAIDSVLTQTLPPLEVLVVDDGSTDGTGEALRKYPVTVIGQQNAGPSSARNRGARQAKGRWLAFLDSDDLWEKEKLERQMAYALEYPDYPLIYTGESWIRNGKPLAQKGHHKKEGGWLYRRSLELCLISPSSVVIRRDFYEEVGGFDEELLSAEDYDLWLRVCHRHQVGYLEAPLTIKKGGHADQLSSQPGIDRFRVMALEKMMKMEDLVGEDRELTRTNLIERYRRLALGYRKHGKKEASYYEERLNYWSEMS